MMTLTQKQRIEALYNAAGLQFDRDWENWPLALLEKIAAAGMDKPREKKCRDCGTSWTAPVPYCPECRGLPIGTPRSESAPITAEDKRWRFLEHGCQWVSWTPTGGETVSFDPRDVKHLSAMRSKADETLTAQVEQLRTEAAELNRRFKR